jgi:2'-5' RNA ligase
MDVSTGNRSKDPHITLVYSKESSVDKNKLLKSIQQSFKDYGVAEIIGAAAFREDDKACIVLKLKSPQLSRINTALCSFEDIKHSYPEFNPHLTLFYDVNQEEADYWVDWLNQRVKGKMLEFKGFE